MCIFYVYVFLMHLMNNKTKRLKALREIVEVMPSASQADLLQTLKERGYNATQPGISRDLRELGIIKAAGRYQPTITEHLPDSPSIVFNHILTMQTAGQNLFVIKTKEGAANVVASEIDHLQLDGVLGTVAGDDTILLATRNRAVQKKLRLRFEHNQSCQTHTI